MASEIRFPKDEEIYQSSLFSMNSFICHLTHVYITDKTSRGFAVVELKCKGGRLVDITWLTHSR